MAARLDKSLDDIINEGKGKSERPRATTDDRRRDRGGRNDYRHDRQHQRPAQERPAPTGPPSFWQHDDRAGGYTEERQQSRPPPAGQRWERGQQVGGGGRGKYAGSGGYGNRADPITTTKDGWEEVAQDEPPQYGLKTGPQRRSGGPSRRSGGIWDRLGPAADDSYNNGYNGYPGQQQQWGDGSSRGQGRGRGREYRPEDDERPKRGYFDEHDHRDEGPRGSRRFEPYSRGGFRGRGRGRSSAPRFKWKHDLYEQTAAEPDAGVQGEQQNGGKEQQEQAEAAMQE